MNFKTLAWHAEQLLGRFQPDALLRPEPVCMLTLLNNARTIMGVRVAAVPVEEVDDVEGYYEPATRMVVLREDVWEAVEKRCDATWRARATTAHEFSHANLDGISMSEDDAWAHAGCLLMPCEMVRGLAEIDDVTVSEVFDVSPQFALRHLYRMKRAHLL